MKRNLVTWIWLALTCVVACTQLKPTRDLDASTADAAHDDAADHMDASCIEAACTDGATADADIDSGLSDAGELADAGDARVDADVTTTCASIDDCDDGLYCNGAEACDPLAPTADARGCVQGVDVDCNDQLPCSTDTCDETWDACRHGSASSSPTSLVTCGARTDVAPIAFPTGGAGIVGQPGMPNWWSGDASFDDPRWVGSFGYGQGKAKMSAFVDSTDGKRALVLKWHVKGDNGSIDAGDQLHVGFYNPTTELGTILWVTRDATVSTSNGVVGAGVMSMYAFARGGSSGLFTDTPMPVTVASQARIDTICHAGPTPECTEWVIRLRVPTSAADGGIDLGDTFRMWFQVDVEHEQSPQRTITRTRFPNGTLLTPGFPTLFPEPLGSSSPVSPAWSEVRIAGSGDCRNGIEIERASDVYVSNVLGDGTQIDLTGDNTFHVRARNNSPFVFNSDSIYARLRITDGIDNVCGTPDWNTLPDLSCATATGPDALPVIYAGDHFDLVCTWTPSDTDRCRYRPSQFPVCGSMLPTTSATQSIMVELFASDSTAVTFASDGVWNIFHFGPH